MSKTEKTIWSRRENKAECSHAEKGSPWGAETQSQGLPVCTQPNLQITFLHWVQINGLAIFSGAKQMVYKGQRARNGRRH